MNRRQKRSPQEYPLLAIRLSLEQKKQLNSLVDDLQVALNGGIALNERKWRKNEIFYQAMMAGLPLLKKKLGKAREST